MLTYRVSSNNISIRYKAEGSRLIRQVPLLYTEVFIANEENIYLDFLWPILVCVPLYLGV